MRCIWRYGAGVREMGKWCIVLSVNVMCGYCFFCVGLGREKWLFGSRNWGVGVAVVRVMIKNFDLKVCYKSSCCEKI